MRKSKRKPKYLNRIERYKRDKQNMKMGLVFFVIFTLMLVAYRWKEIRFWVEGWF